MPETMIYAALKLRPIIQSHNCQEVYQKTWYPKPLVSFSTPLQLARKWFIVSGSRHKPGNCTCPVFASGKLTLITRSWTETWSAVLLHAHTMAFLLTSSFKCWFSLMTTVIGWTLRPVNHRDIVKLICVMNLSFTRY